jgi:hypothetical protein
MKGGTKMKRAVLVGIDDYPGTEADLNSCVNDIKGWKTLMMDRFQFTRENIRLLVNERATKEEVITRLKWLKSGVRDGDTLVFLYSGHGTTFTERDDFGHLDEAKDEALRLNGGYGWQSMLLDDELSEIFADISLEVNLTIICDSCYSGGMADEKNLPLPTDLEHRIDPGAPLRPFGCCLSKKESLEATINNDFSKSKSLLLAACKEDQGSAASRPETKGYSVFSFYAIRALKRSREVPTANDLIKQVAQDIKDADHTQIPQLKGRQDLRDKPLFC